MPQHWTSVIEPRTLGRTGVRVSALGIGDLADRSLPIEQCVATLRSALDSGVTVVDTAPNYEDGFSELIVGEAVRGRRDGLVIVDKVDHLDAPVEPQVEESLRRLGLTHVDVLVFHAVKSLEQWERLLSGCDGVGFDGLHASKKSGKARLVGISCHHPDATLAAIRSGLCDVVMFPVGPFVDDRYIHACLPMARAMGVGTICFKTFGAGKLLSDTTGYNQPLLLRPRGKLSSGGNDAPLGAFEPPVAGLTDTLPRLTVDQCLHYTLTLGPDVALLGLSFVNEQRLAFESASRFRPLPPDKMDQIRREAISAVAGKGPCWWNPA